jgi:TPR repeat protein
MTVGQGNDVVKFSYKTSPHLNAIGMDGVAQPLQASARQVNSFGKLVYDGCLGTGTGLPMDLKGAVHYFKLCADQGNAAGYYESGRCMLAGIGQGRNCENVIRWFRLSAQIGCAKACAVLGWMTENGIETDVDFGEIVQASELSCDPPRDCSAVCGRSCQTGRGVPVDLTVAAEFFQMAASQAMRTARIALAAA